MNYPLIVTNLATKRCFIIQIFPSELRLNESEKSNQKVFVQVKCIINKGSITLVVNNSYDKLLGKT